MHLIMFSCSLRDWLLLTVAVFQMRMYGMISEAFNHFSPGLWLASVGAGGSKCGKSCGIWAVRKQSLLYSSIALQLLTAVPVHGSHSMDPQGMQECREENGAVCIWVMDSSPCHLHREVFHWQLQNLSRWEFWQVLRTPLPAPAVSSPINLLPWCSVLEWSCCRRGQIEYREDISI